MNINHDERSPLGNPDELKTVARDHAHQGQRVARNVDLDEHVPPVKPRVGEHLQGRKREQPSLIFAAGTRRGLPIAEYLREHFPTLADAPIQNFGAILYNEKGVEVAVAPDGWHFITLGTTLVPGHILLTIPDIYNQYEF